MSKQGFSLLYELRIVSVTFASTDIEPFYYRLVNCALASHKGATSNRIRSLDVR